MSAENEENPVHIDPVDVNFSATEINRNIEKTCDSSVELIDTSSNTGPVASVDELPTTTEPEISVIGDLKNDNVPAPDSEQTTIVSGSTSIPVDNNDATEAPLNSEEAPPSKAVENSSQHDYTPDPKPDIDFKEILNENAFTITFQSNESSATDLQSNEDVEPRNSKDSPNFINLNSDLNKCNRNLTTSTVSLDDRKAMDIKANTISKSAYSKSAENISILTNHQTATDNLNSSTKELNSEQILSQFSSQKTKAAATQKLSPEMTKTATELHQNLDTRYTRIPKELLSQDLGSIVKNVHGIFSSVSGSLKNAYNHSQRLPKPQQRVVTKPIPNGKLMDDIFEDDIDKQPTEKLSTEQNVELKREDTPVEEEKEIFESKKDLRQQIETLERVLAEQRKENVSLKERVRQQGEELQEKEHTYKEMEVRVDLMNKRVDQACREKDAAVMRYASVECAAIEAKRAAERAAAAEKAATAEMELIASKLKSAHSEKARICQMYDDKCHELASSERELSKVREDGKELEGRLKWTQSKLRMEMDAYKESSERADRLAAQIQELEVARDNTSALRQTETELKESQAALILCRHEKEDLERRLAATSQLLDTCKKERDSATTDLTQATLEVESLRMRSLQLEEEAAELAALRAQAALADTLTVQLQRETDRAVAAEEALARSAQLAETCARREAAALEHAATLTHHHVLQRAKATTHQSKAEALSVDNASLRERVTVLEAECERLTNAVAEETDRRSKETRALARKVAELTEEAAEANKKLEWENGENSVLKKKHANATKELNRELQRALKRCEQLEAKLPPPDAGSTRTGSVSSLSSGESAPVEERLQNGHAPDCLPDIQVVREPDRQTLIERIVSLQRAAARRAERCEFLEEHARQLTAELRGKARLLRQLLCSLPAGAVASSNSDAHKKEIARLGGGAMAAVWGGDAGGMTLELSLEMNTRLQAVLEDALLKNITLKENMDTLGEEIARLKEQKNMNTENNLK